MKVGDSQGYADGYNGKVTAMTARTGFAIYRAKVKSQSKFRPRYSDSRNKGLLFVKMIR